MRFILFMVFTCWIQTSVEAQTVSLSFTHQLVSISNPRAAAGATFWQGSRSVPTIASNTHYFRCAWAEVQSAHSTFDWTVLDAQINAAIDLNDGSEMVVRIVGIDEGYAGNNIAGSRCSYPAFLHTLMQTESVKDWVWGGNNQWVPAYNGTHWISELHNMFVTLNDHLWNGSHNGVLYRNVIHGIDMMGFGDYNEWHNFGSGWDGTTWHGPAGTQATDATQIAIIQTNVSDFPNFQLYAHISMLYGDESGNSVGAFALNAFNNVGPVGFRSDHTGDAGIFNFEQIKMNGRTVNGVNFKTAWLNRYKVSEITGEIIQPGTGSTNGGANCHGYNLQNEVLTYHYAFFSNDNIDNSQACQVANITAASNSSGYAIRPQSGTMSDSLYPGLNLNISPSFINEGATPTYSNWNTTYELRNGAGDTIRLASSFLAKMFLPGVQNISDNFLVKSTVTGTYSLYLIAKDPNGYRKPLPFQITGRGADGAYLIRSGIHVAVQGTTPPPPPPPPPNNPPQVNAGFDNTDNLPTQNLDTLRGNITDIDGDAVTYTWSQTSGPNTATMATASGSVTGSGSFINRITGLVAGSYNFRLTGNDGKGGISTDDVTITVIAANVPPTVKAGSDIFITSPQNRDTLQGIVTDPNGDAFTVAWAQLSGPNTATQATPTAVTNIITGLIVGTYSFKLTANDGRGGIVSDTVSLFLAASAPPNTPPVVNAGNDIMDTLPVNTASLLATATDADGNTMTYLWTQVSGPNTATMSASTSLANNLSNLIQGQYVFTFTANDGNGGVTSDNMNVFVAAAKPVPPPKVYNPPTITTRGDTIIQATSDSAYLRGNVITKDTAIQSVQWIEFSGPPVTFSNASDSTTKVTGLVPAGTNIQIYQFYFKVTDRVGNIVSTQQTPIRIAVLPVVIPPPTPPAAKPLPMKTVILRQ